MNKVVFEVTPARVRQAANVVQKTDLSTEQADQFIGIFGDEIEKSLTDAFRAVIERHFGARQ